MPFGFLKKVLFISGSLSYPGKEIWQKKLKISAFFLLFFNVLPQLHNVLSKMMHEPLSVYVIDMMFLSYNVTTFINFLIFIRNMADITNLINEINRDLDERTKKFAAVLEKKFRIFFKILLIVLIVSAFKATADGEDFNRYLFDTSFKPVQLFLTAMRNLSQATCDLCSISMLSCYFNICVHIISIHQKMIYDIEEIDKEKSKVERKKFIERFVEFHLKTITKVKILFVNFKWILTFELAFLTFVMSLTFLVIAKGGKDQEKLMVIVRLFLSLILFCYPSEIVTNQVETF